MVSPTPIAVVGIGCRLPGGATDTTKLWDLLYEGRSAWSDVPEDRFSWKSFYHPSPEADGAHNHRGGHFLKQSMSSFDAGYFGIPALEAQAIDPQQRLLLETTVEALENAGMPLENLRGSDTGVYIAMFSRDYDRNLFKDPADLPKYHLTGVGEAIVANRISYLLDLRGPSMTLDTGCSGSMVALHLACQSLRTRESRVTVAGGSNLILSPDHMLTMSQLQMLSNDGKSYSFDSRGAGYGRGEGVGAIVLKRLDDALADGDPIRAVIVNSAVNQDGKTQGITLPSQESQANLERSIYENAGIDPREVTYIEAHGTGTKAGDVAELKAISSIFCEHRDKPVFGYGGTNAHAILEAKPLNQSYKPHTLTNGHTNGRVNGYTNGDSNSHLNGHLDTAISRSPRVIVLTAKSEASVLKIKDNMVEWLLGHNFSNDTFDDLAYTLSSRRSIMPWRISVVADSIKSLSDALVDKSTQAIKASMNSRVVFLFTGQGAQWFAMGRELINTNSVFGRSLRKSDAILAELGAPWSLTEELLKSSRETRINESEIAQPASTALQIAIVDQLEQFGIRPRAVVGHSSGEIAAAYTAGALSHQMALKVSYQRSFISQISWKRLSKKGGMLAAALSEKDALEQIKKVKSGTAVIACVNSPSSVTISGDKDAIAELERILTDVSVWNRKLQVDTAYHSHHMQEVASDYLASLNGLVSGPSKPSIKFVSSVTGQEKSDDFGAAYWVENLVSKVRYLEALQKLCKIQVSAAGPQSRPFYNLVEIGAHAALGGPSRQSITELQLDQFKYSYVSSLIRNQDATNTMLTVASNLFQSGYPVDLATVNRFDNPETTPSVLNSLPPYAWDYPTPHWHESRLSKDYRLRKWPYHDLLGLRVVSSTPVEPSWRHIVSLDTLPWLSEHVIDGFVVFPGAGYLCMAMEAMRQLVTERVPSVDIKTFRLKDIVFAKALVIPASPARVEIQISLRTRGDGNSKLLVGWEEFRITALQGSSWSEHCSGKITVNVDDLHENSQSQISTPTDVDFSFTRDDCYETLSSQALYQELNLNGNVYGYNFAAISDLVLGNCKAIGDIAIPDVSMVMPSKFQQPHTIHPSTLDAIIHPSLPLYSRACSPGSVVPVSIDEIAISGQIFSSPGSHLTVLTTLDPAHRSATANMLVSQGPENTPVLSLSGCELRGLGDSSISNATRDMSFQLIWTPQVDSQQYVINKCPSSIKDSLIEKVARYIQELSLQVPGLKILQLGTSNTAHFPPLAEALKAWKNIAIESFEIASEAISLEDQSQAISDTLPDYLKLKVLHISQDLTGQDITDATYDLVISLDDLASVLNRVAAFTNIKRLLKPNGRLLISYATTSDEDETSRQPYDEAVFLNLFPDSQLLSEDDMESSSLMVFRDLKSQSSTTPVEIRCTSKASLVHMLELSAQLSDTQISNTITRDLTGTINSQAVQIILDDGLCPLLAEALDEEFKLVLNILTECRQVLWVTLPAQKVTAKRSIIRGFARSARAENENLTLVTLDIEQNISASGASRIILEVLRQQFASATEQPNLQELEYVFKNEQLLVPRLLADESINTFLSMQLGEPKIELGLFHQVGKSFTLDARTPGKIQSLRFVENSLFPLGDDELEVTVQAFGIDASDIPIILGQSKGSTLSECSGMISAIGRNITNFQVGDFVVVVGGRAYTSLIRIPAYKAAKLPINMSYIDGATKPAPLMSAYYALTELANLRKGQKVLIHDACSSIGRAALQLSKNVGAEIFATVADTDDYGAIEAYGIPGSHILSMKSGAFKESILKHTKNRGINVVLNSASSDLQESWDCIAPFGVFIDLEGAVSQKSKRLDIGTQGKSARYISFNLQSLCEQRPEEFSRLFSTVLPLALVAVSTDSVTTLPLADIEEAFKLLQTGKAKKNSRRPELELSSDATYVISGGLGDLGQKICGMMAKHGARNFLLLSRRQLTEEQQKSLRIKISAGQPGIHVRAAICDITKPGSVESAVAEHNNKGYPPIKGVVQAAMVLQDRVLEQMTLLDFNRALTPKLHGTLNLDKALENLDFFLMLSSCASIIGNKGQANYAAGNAFLDGFAGIRNGCRYISLNLGMIADSGTISDSQQRQQVLLRQGYIPVNTNELLGLIEYSLGEQGRSRGLDSAVIGINHQSLSHPLVKTASLKNSMFSHILNTAGEQVDIKIEAAQDVKSLILAAKEPHDIQEVILNSLVKQLSALLALEDVNVELPVSAFGLDSLMGIELKNWILKEFAAPLQTSEILDSPNLLNFIELVMTRSQIVKDKAEGKTAGAETGDRETSTKPTNGTEQIKRNGAELKLSQPHVKPNVVEEMTISQLGEATSHGLPRFPLQDLETVLQNYLDAISAFASDDELEILMGQIADMTKLDGIGQKLQARLAEKAMNPDIGNWMADGYDKWNHLLRRAPLYPYGHFYGAHVQPKLTQSQAQRAAVISFSAYEYKKLLDAGIKQDNLNEQPQCMELYKYIFNATREPRVKLDKMSIHEGEHAVVLRNGHIFQIHLQNQSITDLEASFTHVLARSNNQILPMAILPSDERVSWSNVRNLLKKNGNEQALQVVESAAFVVCLEDDSPTTSAERARQFLLGDPNNRWSDKSVQFIVCANGQSAYIADHSMIDGSIMNGINEAITTAILEYKPQLEQGRPDVEELIFNTDGLESHVTRIHKMYLASITGIETLHFTYSDFGGKFFSAYRCPPKTGFQLIIQLAAYQHFGYQVAAWETASLRSFYRGRVEMTQTVVPAIAVFNSSSNSQLPDRKKLLLEAAKAHANLVTSASRGRGYDRHLTSLKFVLEDGESLPAFFSNPVYERTRPRKLITDCSNTPNPEVGIALRDPDGLWIHYEVEDYFARFSVVGTEGRLNNFRKCFDTAANTHQDLGYSREVLLSYYYLKDLFKSEPLISNMLLHRGLAHLLFVSISTCMTIHRDVSFNIEARSSWTFLGCYTDNVSGRALPNSEAVEGGSAAMTNELCQSACQAARFSIAGTEYSGECWCGNAIANGGGPASDGSALCNMVCNGNSAETCGGSNRLDVYQYKPSTSTSTAKRGLAYNNNNPPANAVYANLFTGYSKVSWGYDWGSPSYDLDSSFEFVPMLWGLPSGSDPAWTSAVETSGTENILGFNEPDLTYSGSSNILPADAAAGYQTYMEPFASSVKIDQDCDPSDGASGAAWFQGNVTDAYKALQLPIWITEFECYGTDAQQISFLQTVLPWLDEQSYVARYAYFGVFPDYLVSSDGTSLSDIGVAYATT
ncbi:hypothetical protein B7494_g6896 [Chlorociboria aeruginascens]|nr:hypothetical protein B7494_g6896 [Chlorociboria aeruginascens]